MCFKNLPIEFDEQGNATLVLYPDDSRPKAATTPLEDNPEKIKELLVRNGWLTEEQVNV